MENAFHMFVISAPFIIKWLVREIRKGKNRLKKKPKLVHFIKGGQLFAYWANNFKKSLKYYKRIKIFHLYI